MTTPPGRSSIIHDWSHAPGVSNSSQEVESRQVEPTPLSWLLSIPSPLSAMIAEGTCHRGPRLPLARFERAPTPDSLCYHWGALRRRRLDPAGWDGVARVPDFAHDMDRFEVPGFPTHLGVHAPGCDRRSVSPPLKFHPRFGRPLCRGRLDSWRSGSPIWIMGMRGDPTRC